MSLASLPTKLVEMIKDFPSITKEMKAQNLWTKWYYSDEGKELYDLYESPAQRTEYFYNYLIMYMGRDEVYNEIVYKTAYVIAHSVDNSSLEFGRFPDVLDPEKNPLVQYVRTEKPRGSNFKKHGIGLLAALHNTSENKFANESEDPYKNLTYAEADGSVSDMYKVERDIISVFCMDSANPLSAPYIFDIFNSIDEDDV